MSDKSNVNQIPQHEIDALARCLLPELIAFYESNEGQKEFEQWKIQLSDKEEKQPYWHKGEIFPLCLYCHTIGLFLYKCYNQHISTKGSEFYECGNICKIFIR